MIRFDFDLFAGLLRTAPEPIRFSDEAEYSEYLQKEVFDKLNGGEPVDPSKLDFSAFDFRHVTPEGIEKHYEGELAGWLKSANSLFKLTPAVPRAGRSFF